MEQIYQKINNNIDLIYSDAIKMLSVELLSKDYYKIIELANHYSRKTFKNKGVIFAQIGIDADACPINCQFCQLAVDNFDIEMYNQMPINEIVDNAKKLVEDGADEIFIMSTANYDKEKFIEVGKCVRNSISKDICLVANTGDFDKEYASELLNAGFTGAYHICRLGEGLDTQVKTEERINTINAIMETGLELYYCVEPIGPEHTNQQIADEIFRAINYNVNVMAVMRRICFENSPMTDSGEISAVKMALICAVTVLCVKPKRAMGVHEPEIVSLLAGANQIYAENGSNPRDKSAKTEINRGFSVQKAQKMLIDSQWEIYK